MAATWDSRRLRIERRHDRLLATAHGELARSIAQRVSAAATAGPEGNDIIRNRAGVKDALKADIWTQVIKPFYIGQGDDPLIGNTPQSRYATMIVNGIREAVELSVERELAIIRRAAGSSPQGLQVIAWLTANRPVAEQRMYDPFHRFVDPRGYRLSDRIWDASIQTRTNVDALLDYHIARGTSAVRMGELLEDYMTPGSRLIKTRTPYGREGSFAARRLARTEITAAAGRSTVNASIANPYVEGIQWRLSQRHRCCDICDDHANGGPNGDGIYAPERVPTYPAHPHDLCSLIPVVTENAREVTNQLAAEVRRRSERANRLRGLFNPRWLVAALLSGQLQDAVEQIAA